MQQLETIARPYAKAVFEFALQQNKLDLWASLLQNTALIAANKQVKAALVNPNISIDEILDMFFAILDGKIDQFGKNFLSLLARYNRLGILVKIARLFKKFRMEYEKTVEVKIISAFELTHEQKNTLVKILEKKLQRKTFVYYEIDNGILGGAIIKVGDLVIDGSGRKFLEQLHTVLT